MAYQVKFTETTNPAKPTITVQDQTLNTETSLTFVGKNYAGYAPVVAENFLHLLENFAKNTQPANPVEGQLWYDNSAGVNLLKVYDGAQWNPSGSIKKAATAPLVANSILGDLWVNTDKQQLYVFSGSSWLLVGPQFSSGLKTGPDIEVIVDTNNVDHSVVSMYSENFRIAIISKNTFTPKAVITGFTTINQGVNLSSVDSTNTLSPTRFHGTATSADALLIQNKIVSSGNFLRSDQPSTSNFSISVRSNGGISVGSDLSFNIGTDVNTTVLYSKTSGNSVDIKLNNAGEPTTVVHVDASAKVGIGSNNTSPQEALDVLGSATISGRLIITGSSDPNPGVLGREASITTNGGLNVDKTSTFGADITAYGGIHLNNLDINGDPTEGAVIVPGSTEASGKYDIGTASRKFRNIYANSFIGNFDGAFTGSLTGSISGSSARLASPTAFSLNGEIASNTISFDGQTEDGTAIFVTSVNQSIITNRTLVTDSLLTDQILVFRNGAGLRRMSKQTLASNLATVPIGSLLPFAGLTPPPGYLFCDGSEVRISDYATLYSIIGYSYKTPALLIGLSTFALPDLRGRFPLGRDNMDNDLTVPAKDNPTNFINAQPVASNRVTDVTADIVGSGSGAEQRSLGLINIPEHQHNLNSGLAQYYAVGLPAVGSDPNAVPNLGLDNANNSGSGLPNSGGVDSARLGVPFNTMNPYQTINYIIYTGVI